MIPNLLSIFRMTAFLPVIIFFSFEYYLTSFFLFSAAAWSDFLDGFLARKYNLTSNLGSLLDLVADKILVSSILIFFVFNTTNIVLLILALIIILREISISSLRLFLVYGPGQNNNRFLPQIIKGCLSGESFPVSSGGQLRDFCFVDNVVQANILAATATNEAKNQVYNILFRIG